MPRQLLPCGSNVTEFTKFPLDLVAMLQNRGDGWPILALELAELGEATLDLILPLWLELDTTAVVPQLGGAVLDAVLGAAQRFAKTAEQGSISARPSRSAATRASSPQTAVSPL